MAVCRAPRSRWAAPWSEEGAVCALWRVPEAWAPWRYRLTTTPRRSLRHRSVMEGSRADWSGSSSVSSPRTGQVTVTLSPPGHRLDRGNGHAGSVGGRPSRRTAKKRGRWWGQPQADAARGADLAPQWLPGCVGPLVRRRQRESERGADGLWRRVSSQMERRCRESELLAVVCLLVCRVGACLISNPLMCETFYALSSVVSAHRRFHSLCDPTRPDPAWRRVSDPAAGLRGCRCRCRCRCRYRGHGCCRACPVGC